MSGIPLVYPIFSPPNLPEREVCPRIYKYCLYNTLLFVEGSDIIVCTNSLSVKDFIEKSMPAFLKKNLYLEYFSHQESRNLFSDLYELPTFEKSMALVTAVPKMTPFFKLGLKEYFHLDMDALVVHTLSVNSFGRSGIPLSIPNVLEFQTNPEIHDYLKGILKKRTSLEILDDHRNIPWINSGIYRISPHMLKDFLKKEIYPLYLYLIQEFHQDFSQKPPMNDGDELMFRILLLFLEDKDVCKESSLYNYMPQWIKDTSYDLSQVKIVHYAGPIKHHVYEQQLGVPRSLPSELYYGESQVDDKIDLIIKFYLERKEYIDDILSKIENNIFENEPQKVLSRRENIKSF